MPRKSRKKPTGPRHRFMKVMEPPTKYRDGWLAELDGRTAIKSVMQDRFREMTNDLGGVHILSYAKRSLVERALWLEFWLASQERELASGKQFDAGKWVQGLNGLTGVFRVLGLERVARNMGSLQEYLAARRVESPSDVAESEPMPEVQA